MKPEKTDYEQLEELFNRIENMEDFKIWFGKPCPEFQPKCANCKFWLSWYKFKQEAFEDIN